MVELRWALRVGIDWPLLRVVDWFGYGSVGVALIYRLSDGRVRIDWSGNICMRVLIRHLRCHLMTVCCDVRTDLVIGLSFINREQSCLRQ